MEADHLGLGGVCLAIAPVSKRMDGVREVLHLPDKLEPFARFPVGYPAEDRPRKPL
jgi:nitroreductase